MYALEKKKINVTFGLMSRLKLKRFLLRIILSKSQINHIYHIIDNELTISSDTIVKGKFIESSNSKTDGRDLLILARMFSI